jgi:hypothetical protein
VVSVLLTVPLIVSSAGPAGAASSTAAASTGICASSSHPALAGRIGRAVKAARRDRVSFVAVEVDDPGATARVAASVISPLQETPDEAIP